MWLPIVICLAAVCLIAGPILLMQPTPAERREAKLRQCAMTQGLRVHLQSPPAKASLPRGVKFVAMYCLPYSDAADGKDAWVLVRKSFSHELHVAGFWDWEKTPSKMSWDLFSPFLNTVPEGVLAIASGPQGLCCYWLEYGNTDTVKDMADWLKTAVAALKSD